ncbi:MAG: DUF488 family protein [Syntrophales bacterium]
MKTSYFGNPAVKNDPNAVSIARWSPQWWGSRRRYIDLAPSADLLKRAKAGFSWPLYVAEYRNSVLAKLDPYKVYADLADAIILCYEKPGEKCHRRLVAEWFEQCLGIKVPELQPFTVPMFF